MAQDMPPDIPPVRLPPGTTPEDAALFQQYISQMPISESLSGLSFALSRWRQRDSGTLRVGRRGVVNGEVDMVTAEQARWRLDNWKSMIAHYRERGYSYPTISRIKKRLVEKLG